MLKRASLHLCVAAMLVWLASWPAHSNTDPILLPDIGSSAGNLLSPTEEARLGQSFMRSVRRELPVLEDPVLTEYLQNLGQRLVEHNQSQHKDFTFFLIDQPAINAFAGPGGYIGVYRGLVLAAENESELAAVIAHEISHVTQNHLIRQFDAASRMSGPTALLMLGAVLLGAAVSPDVGMAALAGVTAGTEQTQLNFSRLYEEEADRVGIHLLAAADFDPKAMASFFERMSKATRIYDTSAPELLRTHPVTSNRIADSMGRAEQYESDQVRDSLGFYLLQANLRLRQFQQAKEAVDYFRNTLSQGNENQQAAARYGYALALQQNHQDGQARKQIQLLLKQAPERIEYLLASAAIEKDSGQTKKARRILESALDLYPGSYPLTFAYAELLLYDDDSAKAKKILMAELQRYQGNVPFYQLLAETCGKHGDLSEAHEYRGEAYFHQGLIEPAIQQFEYALRVSRQEDAGFYRLAKLEARLQELKREKKLLDEEE